MRKILIGLGIAVTLVLLAVYGVFYTEYGQDALIRRVVAARTAQPVDTPRGLRVVVCGSASPIGIAPDRAEACIAVVTPEHLFIFDAGARSPMRIRQARLPMERLDAVFLTHFHSDHISALRDVSFASWVTGRDNPVPVFGPEGVERVVRGFNEVYTDDRTYRIAHHGTDHLPPDGGIMVAHTQPVAGVVWEDELIRVTSFPVNHHPVDPAVGYRVDYRGRSVVISGDTVATDSLFEAARDADLLLHDALSLPMIHPLLEQLAAAGNTQVAKLLHDVLDYHADSLSIEGPAREAGIRQVAFYHLVPPPPNSVAERVFRRGLDPDTLLVKDLHTFDLPPNSTEIRVMSP